MKNLPGRCCVSVIRVSSAAQTWFGRFPVGPPASFQIPDPQQCYLVTLSV
jgi:hypothetical protein